MPKHKRESLREAVLALVVLLAALWIFASASRSVVFFGDESRFIWRGRYFHYLFVQRDIWNAEWGDSYWTHTQPMLANYIVGAWLWARGHNLYEVPLPYDWNRTLTENRRGGRVPDNALLTEARQPFIVIAALAVALLYCLARAVGGILVGLTAATLTLGSPLVQEYLPRVLSEAPLAFFLVAGMLLAVLGALQANGSRLLPGWALAIGVALGLGFAAKLTAGLSLVAILSWGLLVGVAAWWTAGPGERAGLSARPALGACVSLANGGPRSSARTEYGTGDYRLRRAWGAASGWLLAVAVGLTVFVLSNPHLYPNPLLHSAHFLENRAEEMGLQQQKDRKYARHAPAERPGIVLSNSLITWTLTGSRGLPLEPALAALGASVLAFRIWRSSRLAGLVSVRDKPRQDGSLGLSTAQALFGVTVLVYFLGVSAALALSYDRYFVPTLMLGTVLSGFGAAAIINRLVIIATRLRTRRQLSPGTRKAQAGTTVPASR